jgi:hypothetical protein
MSVVSEKMPIYDDRVNFIIRSLAEGKTRDELAKEFNHSDYRSLDMYMRRRNFVWDAEEKNYKPAATRINKKKINSEVFHSGKVSKIIQAFSEGKDPKTVASEFGFSDHKKLAEYMKNKGYEWSREEENYIPKKGLENTVESKKDSSSLQEDAKESNHTKQQTAVSDQLLNIVKALQEQLNITESPIIDKIPRYLVPGIAKTKSVQISHLLAQLIEDFSYDKNITQRQIFETAIIDFLYKYGYKHEVEALLGK